MQISSIYQKANLLGVIALFFWLIEPFIVESIKSIPLFLLLSITFFASFIIAAIHITRKKQWSMISQQPAMLFVVGIIGVWLSDLLYIYASRRAPIAYVEFIDYFWPPLFVLFACVFRLHKFSYKELFAHIASIVGLLFILDVDLEMVRSINIYYVGYTIALVGAIMWAGFLTYSKTKPTAPSGMIGLYAGVGAVLSFILHLRFETFVMPSVPDFGLAILLGCTGFGLAYQFWDYGVKHGNIAWLAQANYLSRVLGIILLFIFTDMKMSSNILCGSFLILLSFIASNWVYFKTDNLIGTKQFY